MTRPIANCLVPEIFTQRLELKRLQSSEGSTDAKIKLYASYDCVDLAFVQVNWVLGCLDNMAMPVSAMFQRVPGPNLTLVRCC